MSKIFVHDSLFCYFYNLLSKIFTSKLKYEGSNNSISPTKLISFFSELLIIEDRHISAPGRIGLPQLARVPLGSLRRGDGWLRAASHYIVYRLMYMIINFNITCIYVYINFNVCYKMRIY